MSIHDITPPSGLAPKVKFFAEIGDNCLNVDAAILLCKDTDTPQAKRIYRAFRRRYAEARQTHGIMSPEKLRENAFFAALADCGFNCTFTPINGTMGGGAE